MEGLMKRFPALLLVVVSLMFAGCQAEVFKQNIPVSTNPLGAQILVDGKPAGQTPANVELTRNSDHIVTLTKQGYRQEDVTIKRQYQADSTMLNAVNQGVQDGKFFDDAFMGVNSGVGAIEDQKSSGEAYVLTPSTVKVQLTPVGGIAHSDSSHGASHAATPSSEQTDALSVMSEFDHEVLDRVLESGKSGQSRSWKSPQNHWHFKVVPQPAKMMSGTPVRKFSVVATKDGKHLTAVYPAYRENSNDWRIGYPHQVTGAPKTAPVDGKKATFDALKAAAAGMGDIGGSKKVGGSSHSKESFGKDGSYSKTTTKSSTSVGASINPEGAVDLLEKLTEGE